MGYCPSSAKRGLLLVCYCIIKSDFECLRYFPRSRIRSRAAKVRPGLDSMHWLQEARAFPATHAAPSRFDAALCTTLALLSLSIGKFGPFLLATLKAVVCKPFSVLYSSISSHKGAACAISWHPAGRRDIQRRVGIVRLVLRSAPVACRRWGGVEAWATFWWWCFD